MVQEPDQPVSITLETLSRGSCAVVSSIDAAQDDISRLMSMGVCVGRKIEMVQAGDPLILRVWGSRIGVSARLARRVEVQPCANPECQGPGEGQ